MPSKPYLQLVADAIAYYNQRAGSSRHAIAKYIKRTENLGTLTGRHFTDIAIALKRGVQEGFFLQKKQSFRIAKDHKKQRAKKAKADEKKKAPNAKKAGGGKKKKADKAAPSAAAVAAVPAIN